MDAVTGQADLRITRLKQVYQREIEEFSISSSH
jgi:hypothetical protein